MEQHDPTRRQYAPSTYVAQPTQQQDNQLPSQYAAPNPSERFRQSAYPQQSSTTASPQDRSRDGAQQVYDFHQSAPYGAVPALPSNAMQYGQEMQDPQRQQQQHQQQTTQQQQQQQYPAYGANIMYNMPQPPAHPSQGVQSHYEPNPQYRHRTSAASETLATPFGVPQNGQYYLAAGQPGPTSAPAPELSAHQIGSQYPHHPYPQPGSSVSQAYSSAIIDTSPAGAYTYAPQQPHQYSNQQQTQQQQQPPLAQGVDSGSNSYQSRLRNVFTLVRKGTLGEVATPLIQASHYLLGNAESLGLTRDDDALHDERIELWNRFNRAWLTTLQRQFDLTDQVLRHQQQPPPSLMSAQTLEQLSRELVRLCDNVERHGLVDYQMGVAEEEIMDLLLRCLALLDPTTERAHDATSQPDASTAAPADRPGTMG